MNLGSATANEKRHVTAVQIRLDIGAPKAPGLIAGGDAGGFATVSPRVNSINIQCTPKGCRSMITGALTGRVAVSVIIRG